MARTTIQGAKLALDSAERILVGEDRERREDRTEGEDSTQKIGEGERREGREGKGEERR